MKCSICGGIPSTGHTSTCPRYEQSFTEEKPQPVQQETTPVVPPAVQVPTLKQEDLLRHINYLTEKFPKGFFILIMPDQGTIFQMYKHNPFFARLLEYIEHYVKQITEYRGGPQN